MNEVLPEQYNILPPLLPLLSLFDEWQKLLDLLRRFDLPSNLHRTLSPATLATVYVGWRHA